MSVLGSWIKEVTKLKHEEDVATAKVFALGMQSANSDYIGPLLAARLQSFIDSYLLPPPVYLEPNDRCPEYIESLWIPIRRLKNRCPCTSADCMTHYYLYSISTFRGSLIEGVTNKRRRVTCDLGEKETRITYVYPSDPNSRNTVDYYTREAELVKRLKELNYDFLLLCGLLETVEIDTEECLLNNFVYDNLGEPDPGCSDDYGKDSDEAMRYFEVRVGIPRENMLHPENCREFYNRYRAVNYLLTYAPKRG